MRFTRLLLLLLILLLASAATAQQEGDYDGDGIPDNEDYCIAEPGTADYNGCTAATFPDYDQDTVGDPVDSCPNDQGLPDNSGCPAGVVPDYDSDGLTDSLDACPREYGDGADGCPPDADGDRIPDFTDACPFEAGVSVNLGCPDGTTPPDADGDNVVDLYDACPAAPGARELGGCPDVDADGVIDVVDACPDQAGTPDFFGCVESTTTTLPAALTPISAGNAASLAEVGRLVVGTPRIALLHDRLAVRAGTNVSVYDLNAAPNLSPVLTANTGSTGYAVAVSANFVATLDLPTDFTTPPFVQIRDGATGAPRFQLVPPADARGQAAGVSAFAFNPTNPDVLAVAPLTGSAELVGVRVPLINVATNTTLAEFPLPSGAVNLAFSRDGSRLAVDTTTETTMAVYLFDPVAGIQVGGINTTGEIHFAGTPLAYNRDGTRLAIGYPDGSVHLWDTPRAGLPAEAFSAPLFNDGEIVSAVAFSPDGTLIAAAGGLPFSGGLTGNEEFSIVVIDAATGAEVARWSGHQSLIRDLVFNDAGTLLVSAADTTVRFWGISE
ncbi:MAG: thrombospondin type 3 repeat-containing protein [Anaerolinea sp.]|nr:thrombospondin type 3 repeat-containing protein [Anaerolinea sp.]